MSMSLTKRQRAVMLFIQRRMDAGEAPTYREMSDALGIRSRSTMHRIVAGLEERGYLRRIHRRARCLELLQRIVDAPDPEDAYRAALVRIAAGARGASKIASKVLEDFP